MQRIIDSHKIKQQRTQRYTHPNLVVNDIFSTSAGSFMGTVIKKNTLFIQFILLRALLKLIGQKRAKNMATFARSILVALMILL